MFRETDLDANRAQVYDSLRSHRVKSAGARTSGTPGVVHERKKIL